MNNRHTPDENSGVRDHPQQTDRPAADQEQAGADVGLGPHQIAEKEENLAPEPKSAAKGSGGKKSNKRRGAFAMDIEDWRSDFDEDARYSQRPPHWRD